MTKRSCDYFKITKSLFVGRGNCGRVLQPHRQGLRSEPAGDEAGEGEARAGWHGQLGTYTVSNSPRPFLLCFTLHFSGQSVTGRLSFPHLFRFCLGSRWRSSAGSSPWVSPTRKSSEYSTSGCTSGSSSSELYTGWCSCPWPFRSSVRSLTTVLTEVLTFFRFECFTDYGWKSLFSVFTR